MSDTKNFIQVFGGCGGVFLRKPKWMVEKRIRAPKDCLEKNGKLLCLLFDSKKDLKTFLFWKKYFFEFHNIKISIHRCGNKWGIYASPSINGNKKMNWKKYIKNVKWDKWEKEYRYTKWEKVKVNGRNYGVMTVEIRINTYAVKIKREADE